MPLLSSHSSSDVMKVSVTPAEESGREVLKEQRKKGKADRKRQCEMSTRKTRRGSERLICVSKTFPHIVSRVVRWERGSET